MALTAEERAEINRRNAAKSTGPKSEAGKDSSRRNALKHGLRAEALALPNEDPAAVAARSEAWNDYYRPQSPAAQHLVNACVAATLLSDRCQRYQAAALSSQVREAEYAWDLRREEAVADLAAALKVDPATAARRLGHTGYGCRWLIERWGLLLKALDDRGRWTDPERDEAIRLQGFHPDPETIRECPEAWLTRLFALACYERRSAAAVEWLFHPNRLPDLHRNGYRPESLPDRASCQTALRAMIAGRLNALRETEEALRTSLDDPDRAGAADRALILHDGASARLFLRYHAEARTSFQRAYGSLVKALESDADADADLSLSPNEAKAPTPAGPATPTEAVSPNKADSDAKVDDVRNSDDSSGLESAADGQALAVATDTQPTRKARTKGEPVGTILLRLLDAPEPAPRG